MNRKQGSIFMVGVALVLGALGVFIRQEMEGGCPVKLGEQVFHPRNGRGIVLMIAHENASTSECVVGVRFIREEPLVIVTEKISAWKLFNSVQMRQYRWLIQEHDRRVREQLQKKPTPTGKDGEMVL